MLQWYDEDRRHIRPKRSAKSQMVSALLCEFHGLLRLPEEHSQQYPEAPSDFTEIIKPGRNAGNAEGYWTDADLVKQTKLKSIPIFKILHPHSDVFFMYDNSANHHAFAPDALMAHRLNLKDGGANMKVIMRDGWFMNVDGERISHSFLTASGEQKGLRTILKERNLCRDGMKRPDACALLKTQFDFIEQKEWLTETVMVEPGFDIGFFPKFHCELNFIEMFWGAVKRFTRIHCNYSLNSLVSILPAALSSVSIDKILRFA